MLYSMTGYGRATKTIGTKTIVAEVRALNSKLVDIKLRFPGDLKEKDLEMRRFVLERAIRGKIDLLLDIQSPHGMMGVSLNEGLFKSYHQILSSLAGELSIPQGDLLQTIVRIPNVITPPTSELTDEEWDAVFDTIAEATDALMEFRKTEGEATETDIVQRTGYILELLDQITPFGNLRHERMRTRIMNNMEEVIGKEKIDANRFEQELLFYLERMDFSEEVMRLRQHCTFFLEQLANDTTDTGRKLNFISQEMGREINTLGAKAYDSDIQRIVVTMKDELEKIKEQLANIL